MVTDCPFELSTDGLVLYDLSSSATETADLTLDLSSHPVTMATCCEQCACSKNTPDSTLFKAVKNNHPQCVKDMISKGADVNEQNDIDSTPIIVGAVKGSNDCVKILIKAGADVNHVNQQFESALIFAAYFSNEQLVKLLIEAGADVNIKSKSGETALMQTAKSGNTACTRLLIDAGADVNDVDKIKFTSLTHAACSGDQNVLKMLIDAGADVNHKCEHGLTPTMYAVQSGKYKCLEFLIKFTGHCPSVLPFIKFTPSRAKDNEETVKVLLRAGMKVNVPDQEENNVLRCQILHADWLDNIRGAQNGHVIHYRRCMLLYAAGNTVDCATVAGTVLDRMHQAPVPDYLLFTDLKLNLKHLCREAIRKHLLNVDPHTHLFGRVPRLGLPPLMNSFLLYNMSLDDDDEINNNN